MQASQILSKFKTENFHTCIMNMESLSCNGLIGPEAQHNLTCFRNIQSFVTSTSLINNCFTLHKRKGIFTACLTLFQIKFFEFKKYFIAMGCCYYIGTAIIRRIVIWIVLSLNVIICI